MEVITVVLIAVLSIVLIVSGTMFILAFYNANKKDVTYNLISGPDYDEYHNKMIETIKTAEKIPYEELYIKSRDGLNLFGRLYLQNPKRPVHIQFHGYRDNGIKDFCGGMQLALKTGGNVIIVDQRAHGKSDGHIISFGIKERYDVLCWINYVKETFGEDTKIFLEGISMGAATVLMASDLALPDNVKGIMADCPYSDPFGIIKKVAADTVPFSKLLSPFIIIAATVFGHFNIFEASAVKSVTKAKVPILLIHGTGDHFVPVEMSRDIYNANPKMITKVEVDGAPHGLSYLKNHKLYEDSFIAFINGEKSLDDTNSNALSQ